MLEAMRLSDNFVLRENFSSNEHKAYLFNVIDGDAFEINEVACFILKMLQDSKNKEEILKKLCSDFDIMKEQAEKDFNSFVKQCIQANVLIKRCDNE